MWNISSIQILSTDISAEATALDGVSVTIDNKPFGTVKTGTVVSKWISVSYTDQILGLAGNTIKLSKTGTDAIAFCGIRIVGK